MLVGVDFDNTIVCYDQVFARAAVERSLIGKGQASTKEEVRDALRGAGREADWTELQGHVYGLLMADAPPFPGVRDFFGRCASEGVPVCIISHRTKRPVIGPPHDLHNAARQWLRDRGFFDSGVTGLAPDRVWLEVTKEEKLSRIGAMGCTHFIDDLPEFLGEPSFPDGVERILFDPARRHPAAPFRRAVSWNEIEAQLFGETPRPGPGRASHG